MSSVKHLRELMRQAEASGVPRRALEAAARELVELLDRLAIEPDRRRLETLERGARIARLVAAGGARRQICERLGISPQSYHRALSAFRDSRNSPGADSRQATEERSP